MAQSDVPTIELEYVFSVRIDFSTRIALHGPERTRMYVPAAGGEVWGPRLQGKVVPHSGADFTGDGLLNAHYMLQASDGTWIYVNNMGYEYSIDHGDVDRNVSEPDGDRKYYCRVTPYFDAPIGPHDWLSHTVIVGTGQHHADPDHTIFTYYALK